MSLSENLQNLRKIKNMSQEELAEKLEVSRQAVSKWESGNGYPETEKLISICEIFDCSMDELVKGKISLDVKEDKNNYDSTMSKVAKGIAAGVGLILLGVSALLTLVAFGVDTPLEERLSIIGVVMILISITIAVPMFIINGFQKEDFKKKNIKVANVYSEEEIEKGKSKYTKILAFGVSTILLGVVVMMLLYAFNVFGMDSVFPVAILMYLITIGTTTIVYSGQMIDKYDIEKYNRQNTEEFKQNEEKSGKICGVIMLTATIIYLISGFIWNLWHISWIVFPVGGILCGIVGTILGKDK